jgi:transposase
LAPGCKISGGKVLSAPTRKTTSRVGAHLRLAAVTVGRTDTALAAFLSTSGCARGQSQGRDGDGAQELRCCSTTPCDSDFGLHYQDPGADHYERRYRERVVKQLHRRAAQFGFTLESAPRSVS